jgi:hypothetical protein
MSWFHSIWLKTKLYVGRLVDGNSAERVIAAIAGASPAAMGGVI